MVVVACVAVVFGVLPRAQRMPRLAAGALLASARARGRAQVRFTTYSPPSSGSCRPRTPANTGALLDGRNASDCGARRRSPCLESTEVAREDALKALAEEHTRIMRLSRQDAIREVLAGRRLGARTRAVETVAANVILDIGE